MPDISNPNLCGSDAGVNKLLNKFQEIKEEIEAGLDKAASELKAALDVELTELEGDLRALVPELPSAPALNLQAEIKALQGLIPGTPEFIGLSTKLENEFGEALTQAGQDLNTIIEQAVPAINAGLGELSGAVDSLLGGGLPDVCKLCGNLEKVEGEKDSDGNDIPPVEKAAAVLQAKEVGEAEEESKIVENLNIKEAVAEVEAKVKNFLVTSEPPKALGSLFSGLKSAAAVVTNPATINTLQTASARMAGQLNALTPQLNEAAVIIKTSVPAMTLTTPVSLKIPTTSSFSSLIGGLTQDAPVGSGIPTELPTNTVSVATPTSSAIVTTSGEVKKANLVDKGGITYRVMHTSELLYFKDAKPHPSKKSDVENFAPNLANNKPLLCWQLKEVPYTITSVRAYHTVEELDDGDSVFHHDDVPLSAFRKNAKAFTFREMYAIDNFDTDTNDHIAVTNIATARGTGALDFEWTGHDPNHSNGEGFKKRYVGVSLRVVYTTLEEYDAALAMADEEAASGSNPDA